MAKKIEVFASEALPGELEDFPNIKRGWGTTKESTGGIPPMKWFNSIQKRTDEAINSIAGDSINGYTFKEGATLSSVNDFIYDDTSNSWYFWTGSYPKVINKDSVASEVIESDGGLGKKGGWFQLYSNSSMDEKEFYPTKGEGLQDLINRVSTIDPNGTINMYGFSFEVTQGINFKSVKIKFGELYNKSRVTAFFSDGFTMDSVKITSKSRYSIIFDGVDSSKDNYIVNCKMINEGEKGVLDWYFCIRIKNTKGLFFLGNTAINGGCWFDSCEKSRITNNYINVNFSGGINPGESSGGVDQGTDCIKLHNKTSGVISENILINPSRDCIDGFTSGRELIISSNYMNMFAISAIELKTNNKYGGVGDHPENIVISNNLCLNGGWDASRHSAIFLVNAKTDIDLDVRNIIVSSNIIENVGLNQEDEDGAYHGVYVSRLNNAVISNNIINDVYRIKYKNKGASGVRVDGCNNVSVNNNLISSTFGIEIVGSKYVSASSNKISNPSDSQCLNSIIIGGISENINLRDNQSNIVGGFIYFRSDINYSGFDISYNNHSSDRGHFIELFSASNFKIIGNSSNIANGDLFVIKGELVDGAVTNNSMTGRYLLNSNSINGINAVIISSNMQKATSKSSVMSVVSIKNSLIKNNISRGYSSSYPNFDTVITSDNINI